MEKLKYNVLRVEAERKNYLEELRHRFDVAVSDISTPEGAKLEFARGKMSVQEGRAGQLLYGESALSMSFSADLQTLIRLLLTSEPFTEPTNGAADFFADGTYGGSRIDFFAGMTGTTGTGDNQASQGEANEQSTPGETSNWNPFDTTTIRIRTVAGIELKPALLIRSEDSLESWQAAFDRVHSIGYGPDILLYFDKLNNNLGRTVLQIFEYMERHDFDHSFVVNGDEYILVRVIGYWRVSISPSQTDHLLKDFLAVTWHGIQLWKTGERWSIHRESQHWQRITRPTFLLPKGRKSTRVSEEPVTTRSRFARLKTLLPASQRRAVSGASSSENFEGPREGDPRRSVVGPRGAEGETTTGGSSGSVRPQSR